ncbi:MAG: acyl-CoA synthetase [Rhodobacteraceae bacterium]|nr:acyl-CoA synthetase [Paracoccaceae bacterium]
MTGLHRRPIVSVIGDSRLAEDDIRLALARRTGPLLVDHGYVVMTGGMGGVMHAALEGGHESANWSVGCCIGLIPGTDPDNSDVSKAADIVIPTGLDHARNLVVAQSDAVIAIGGGAGTLSEMAYAWIQRRLIIALRCEGWSDRLADERIDKRLRYPEVNDDRVYGADTAEEAVALAQELGPLYRRRHRSIAG